MTKTKKGVDYSKVAPVLVEQVRDVIAAADKHTYSVSRVYAAYNAIFELRETPQTCSSCLRNRTRDLRDWLRGYDDFMRGAQNEKRSEVKQSGEETGTKDPNNPRYDAPAVGDIRIPMKEGAPIDLTPFSEDDRTKGTVAYADGTKVTPGKYIAEHGETIVVQAGGKGRVEVEDLT